ncbi:MAG TPA: uL13 family ribosomal protein [Candidatus Paceibacterota bacterium]|nr:uL13 family ribosomal protein [Candidatus Paceibacterota bacterium]
MEHTIDASGKTLGRVAAAAARLLLGKEKGTPRRLVAPNKVKITNANQVVVTAKKLRQTVKARYSGYPGGLRKESWQQIVSKKGYPLLLRQIVSGMIPNNKLKKARLKNLEITQ